MNPFINLSCDIHKYLIQDPARSPGFQLRFWVLIVCLLGEEVTSKAPNTSVSWVPNELNKVHRCVWKSSYTSPVFCCPPGRKAQVATTKPAPAPIIRLIVSESSPTPGKVKWKELERSSLSLTCVFELWGLKLFLRPRSEVGATVTQLVRQTNEVQSIFRRKKSRKLLILNANSSKS